MSNPQLAPAPLIYVFESNCAYIVLRIDKLRAGTKTAKNPHTLLFIYSPNFFQEAYREPESGLFDKIRRLQHVVP